MSRPERSGYMPFTSPGFCRECGDGWQHGPRCSSCGGKVNAEY